MIVPNFLTPQQAADMLGITRGTLANWRMTDKGPPYYRVGKREVFYTVADVKRWMQKHGRAIH
jgi:excisionase family DNA binding protein